MKETTYELRELCSKDIFPMFKIISKIGVKEFKKCFESDEVKQMIASGGTDNVDSIGMTIIMDVVSIVVDNIARCEKDIYKLLSGLSGMKESEIAELPMNTFVKMVIDVIKKDEFKDFIQVVSELFE